MGGREGEREGGREGGIEEGMERGREEGRKGWRKGGREGEREGEGWGEEGREGITSHINLVLLVPLYILPSDIQRTTYMMHTNHFNTGLSHNMVSVPVE